MNKLEVKPSLLAMTTIKFVRPVRQLSIHTGTIETRQNPSTPPSRYVLRKYILINRKCFWTCQDMLQNHDHFYVYVQ
ncbi:hypothetical protein EUGRSUZ_A01187 [Eucalyptus grandis]|uniref:Uncharacterized protein n=2 Tax=Eucalyptus grandis TaxID=71139 RepID=A0ACC3M309_EUCGR|nr:hypothetical protein EUGRSUZ_A01187 [Eucalyptus grandis]